MLIRTDQRFSAFGKTGCGKTELLKRIIRDMNNVLVIDLKPSWALNQLTDFGFKIVNYPKEINWTGQIKYVFRPINFNDLDAQLEQVLNQAYEKGNLMIVFDEIVIGSDAYDMPPAVAKVIRMGRERGVGTGIVTQKPTRINSAYFSESDHFFIFRLQYSGDRNRINSLFGEEIGEKIIELDEYEFLYFTQGTAEPKIMKLDLKTGKLDIRD